MSLSCYTQMALSPSVGPTDTTIHTGFGSVQTSTFRELGYLKSAVPDVSYSSRRKVRPVVMPPVRFSTCSGMSSFSGKQN